MAIASDILAGVSKLSAGRALDAVAPGLGGAMYAFKDYGVNDWKNIAKYAKTRATAGAYSARDRVRRMRNRKRAPLDVAGDSLGQQNAMKRRIQQDRLETQRKIERDHLSAAGATLPLKSGGFEKPESEKRGEEKQQSGRSESNRISAGMQKKAKRNLSKESKFAKRAQEMKKVSKEIKNIRNIKQAIKYSKVAVQAATGAPSLTVIGIIATVLVVLGRFILGNGLGFLKDLIGLDLREKIFWGAVLLIVCFVVGISVILIIFIIATVNETIEVIPGMEGFVDYFQ